MGNLRSGRIAQVEVVDPGRSYAVGFGARTEFGYDPHRRGGKRVRRQFVQFFGPVLQALDALGGEGRAGDVRGRVVQDLKIPERQRRELMAGGSSRFGNQIAWARFYLAKAGFIDSPRRGVWRLTEEGRAQVKMTDNDAFALARRIESEVRARKARGLRPQPQGS